VTEPPEHRVCRTKTTPERRGVESALNEWRLGDSNWRNVYIGTRHVGVIWESGLPALVIAAMNGDPDRDERLRHAGAVGAARDIEAELQTHFDLTGDPGVREAAAVVRAYVARGFQRHAEPPEWPGGHTGTPEPPQTL
jgi:hypothetical protein